MGRVKKVHPGTQERESVQWKLLALVGQLLNCTAERCFLCRDCLQALRVAASLDEREPFSQRRLTKQDRSGLR